ncbi:hypothetical protein C0J52_07818 [Blattella germanica]|nr:hypothetical protein C0J52_07818 [Blattella germanica]
MTLYWRISSRTYIMLGGIRRCVFHKIGKTVVTWACTSTLMTGLGAFHFFHGMPNPHQWNEKGCLGMGHPNPQRCLGMRQPEELVIPVPEKKSRKKEKKRH